MSSHIRLISFFYQIHNLCSHMHDVRETRDITSLWLNEERINYDFSRTCCSIDSDYLHIQELWDSPRGSVYYASQLLKNLFLCVRIASCKLFTMRPHLGIPVIQPTLAYILYAGLTWRSFSLTCFIIVNILIIASNSSLVTSHFWLDFYYGMEKLTHHSSLITINLLNLYSAFHYQTWARLLYNCPTSSRSLSMIIQFGSI